MIDVLRIGRTGTQALAHRVLQTVAALGRQQKNAANNYPAWDRTDIEANYWGLGAEIILRLWLGLPIRYDVLVLDYWHRIPNGILPNGWEYDVRCTWHQTGRLSMPKKFRDTPSRDRLYLLMTHPWSDPHTYTFRGWAHGAYLIREANRTWYRPDRDGSAFELTQTQIRRWGSLPITGQLPLDLSQLPPDDTPTGAPLRQVKRQPRHIGRRQMEAQV